MLLISLPWRTQREGHQEEEPHQEPNQQALDPALSNFRPGRKYIPAVQASHLRLRLPCFVLTARLRGGGSRAQAPGGLPLCCWFLMDWLWAGAGVQGFYTATYTAVAACDAGLLARELVPAHVERLLGSPAVSPANRAKTNLRIISFARSCNVGKGD